MRRLVCACLLAVLSCSKDTPREIVEVAPAAVPQQPRDAAVDGGPFHVVSVASFNRDELAECVDFVVAGSIAGIEGDAGNVVLSKPCYETFKGRMVVASCAIDAVPDAGHVDAGFTMKMMVQSLYRVEGVFESDRYMRECLEEKGTWNAVPRDAPEVQRALRDAHRKKADEVIKKLGLP